MNRCEDCIYYWSGPFNDYCHNEYVDEDSNAMLDCPFFEEKEEPQKEER